MKKKKALMLFCLVLGVLGFSLIVKAEAVVESVGGGANNNTCTGIFGPNLLAQMQSVLNIIQIVAPILLILLTSLDFAKAVFSDNKDALKKAKDNFLKRAVAILIVFFAPNIISLILSLVDEATINGDCIEAMKNAKYVEVPTNNEQIPSSKLNDSDITPTEEENGFYSNMGAVRSIYINPRERVSLQLNNTYQAYAEVNMSAINKKIIWSSDNSNVARVSENGLITAVGYGYTKIYATADGDRNMQAYVEVEVKEPEKDELLVETVSCVTGDSFLNISVKTNSDFDYNRLYFSIDSDIDQNNLQNATKITEYLGFLIYRIAPKDKKTLYFYDRTLGNRDPYYIDMKAGETINFMVAHVEGNNIKKISKKMTCKFENE